MPEGERRSNLLAIAAALFRQHGYAAVSIADIAAATGVSKATVLHHFGSKEALYAEIMRDTLMAISAAVGRIAASADTVPDKLGAMARAAIVWVDADADLDAMLHDADEHLSPEVRREIAHAHAAIGAGVEEIMRQGISAGALAKRDPDLLAHAFWHLIGGFAGRRGAQAGFQGRPEVADTIVALFLDGAASPAEGLHSRE
jgi:AcrR family transcriptional regulator